MKKLLWIVPEERGGIRSYSDALWTEVAELWAKIPGESTRLALAPLNKLPSPERLRALAPDLIHIQHEYGLFRSKIPGLYSFPSWLAQARLALPQAKIVATGHTILGADYLYPWKGRGLQTPFRWLANQALLPVLRYYWREKTWGALDGVIVHSSHQVRSVERSGCPVVREIPHLVFETSERVKLEPHSGLPVVLLFGFITPEKGQDIALEAFMQVKTPSRLILAGGARRRQDQLFLKHCEALVREMRLEDRVQITGFVPASDVGKMYEKADLVLAPFRETSGSGSLAQALARGAPILTSALPLNQEIEVRQPGALAFFKSENAADCAHEIDRLLGDLNARRMLGQNALKYAQAHFPAQIALKHIEFYRSFELDRSVEKKV